MRAFAMVLMLTGLSGCSSSEKGCSTGAGAPDFCFCPEGRSCIHACGPRATCSLDCANRNQSCQVTCQDNCSALCQGADTCDATCGANCLVACQGTKSRCTATVGDNADVRCELATFCDITCTGSCKVDCPTGNCRVACQDPARCEVACEKAADAGVVPLCPDGKTKVCRVAC